MADNVEVKLEQLTDAIRSLYSRPSLTQSEINNLMTSLAQKFENSTELSTQKFIGVIINETKKVLEEKQLEMRQQLTGFENLIKQMTQSLSNPKMSMEVTKILNEVTDMYAKLGAQEIALQKVNQTLIANKSANPINEIIKLSNEFNVFSRGFENITHTLNKNFTDFLNQVKSYNSKEEITEMQLELDTINGNINSIISALAIIDHKYRDLTGLIDAFHSKEAVFDQSLEGIKNIAEKFDHIKEDISKGATKDDITALKEHLDFVNKSVDTVNENINQSFNQNSQKFTNAINLIETKLSQNPTMEDLNNLKGEIKTSIDKLSVQSSTNKDDFIAKLQENITKLKAQSDADLKSQIFDHANGVNEGINYISSQMTKLQENLGASFLDKTQKMNEDVGSLKNKLDLIEQTIQKLPRENILQEVKTIEESLKTLTKNSLSSIVELVSSEFSSLDKSLENKGSENNQKIDSAINNLRDDIKIFAEKFSTLKDEISSLNQGSINTLKEPLEKALRELRETTIDEQLNIINQNIKNTTSSINSSFEKIKENFEHAASGTNVEILSKLNNAIPVISEKFEILRGYLAQENAQNSQELKDYFQETSEAVKEYINEIKDSYNSPLTEIKVDLQTLSNYLIESVENININISKEFEEYKNTIEEFLPNADNSEIKEALNSIKNDLIEGILGSTKNAKANFIILEEKINKILENQGTNNENVIIELINKILENQAQKNDNETVELIKKVLENQTESKEQVIIELINKVIENQNQKNDNETVELIKKVLENQNQKQTLNNEEIILEVINNILEKIEHNNQQQIHNAKELLEEIQNNSSEINEKISSFTKKEPLFNNEILHRLNAISEKLEVSDTYKEDEIKDSIELLKDHIENIAGSMREEFSNKISEISQNKEEKPQEKNPNVNEYLTKINEYLTNVEYLKNNLSEDLKDCIENQVNNLHEKFKDELKTKNQETKIDTYNLIQKVTNVESNIDKITSDISKIINTNDETNYDYSLQDVESDIAKLRLTIEKNLKGDNYKEFINRLIELKNINIENNKLNHALEGQMSHLNNWFKSAAQKLEGLSEQIENAEKMNMEEIKTRLIRSEKSPDGGKIEEATRRQISYLEDLDEKLNVLLQRQQDGFDPNSFIDVTYENMKQTKELASRMDEMEVKIDKIQGYMEKIVAYIEE